MNSLDKVFTIVDTKQLENEDLINQLTAEINQMILTNFETLVQLLYRIDVSEVKLKSLLKENPNEDAGKIIAQLIIERQLQKLESKRHTREDFPDTDNNNDAEAW